MVLNGQRHQITISAISMDRVNRTNMTCTEVRVELAKRGAKDHLQNHGNRPHNADHPKFPTNDEFQVVVKLNSVKLYAQHRSSRAMFTSMETMRAICISKLFGTIITSLTTLSCPLNLFLLSSY